MKKILSVICLLAAGAVMLTATGCGSNEDDTSSTETTAELSVTLGDYKGMEVEYEKQTVADEDVDDAIVSAINQNAEQVEITDRAVKDGDTVNIDYVGKVDGVEFDGGSGEAYDLTIGSGSFIDDFEEQLIGANIGDTLDVQVTFPDPYQNNPDMSGAEAVFTVKINSIKAYPEVELTDTLINEHTEGAYTTLDDYRAYMKESLETSAESTNTTAKQNAISTKLMEICTVENPTESRVKTYMDNYYSQYEAMASQYGMEFSALLEAYSMTEDTFESQVRTSSEYTVSLLIIFEEIAKEQKIEVTDDEYSSYLEEQATAQSTDASTLENYYGDLIKDTLIQEKVMEYLMGVTTFTEAN